MLKKLVQIFTTLTAAALITAGAYTLEPVSAFFVGAFMMLLCERVLLGDNPPWQ